MPGQSPTDPAGRFCVLNRANCQTVIADNTLTIPTNDVGLRAASILIEQGKPFQETIKRLLSAVKGVDAVGVVQLLNRRIGCGFRCHSSTLFSANSRAKRGFSVTGRSSAS